MLFRSPLQPIVVTRTMTKTQLHALIAAGKTRAAIESLLTEARSDRDLHTEALALSARFQNFTREKNGGRAEPAWLDAELNRIHAAALDLIERLPEDSEAVTLSHRLTTPARWKSATFWTFFLTILGLLIGLLAYLNDFGVFPFRKPEPVTTRVDTLPARPADAPQEQSDGMTSSHPVTTTSHPLTTDTTLRVFCKTNKGDKNLRFRKGEDMQLLVSASQPCYLRVFYKLADGSIALLDDGRQITAAETNRFVQTGPDFTCEAPFGPETLYVFAQNAPFQKLNTTPDPDGYTRVTDNLPNAIQKTRGFKAKNRFAEARLEFLTAE